MKGQRRTLFKRSFVSRSVKNTALTGVVALAVLFSMGSAQAGRHDSYSGATDSYSGATDGYSGATQNQRSDDRHRYERDLERRQRRALERFEQQREREYRRLDQRRFRSDRARERAYRDLDERHEARLRDILGDSRYRQEHRRYDDYDRRGYDNPEEAVINLILRELLSR